jgi:hypothetical protein
MSILQKIRLGAAIALLCAIVLPLSQCAHAGNNERTPEAFAHARHLFPQSDANFSYQYGIKQVGFSLAGALAVIAFAWPLGFAIWSRKSHMPRFWWIFYASELLLCAGTAYWINALTQGGRWLYGFYVAEAVVAVYASTTLISISHRLRTLLAQRRAMENTETQA